MSCQALGWALDPEGSPHVTMGDLHGMGLPWALIDRCHKVQLGVPHLIT